MATQHQILDELEARLKSITTLNGYLTTFLPEVINRARTTPFLNGDLPAINYWPTVDALFNKPDHFEERELNIVIEAYIMTRDEPFTDVSFKLGNDIITSIFRHTNAPKVTDTPSLSLGDLVNTILINSITPVIGEGDAPWCGVIIDLGIFYNIQVGNFSVITNY